MRVLITGSRKWTDRDAIANRLFELPPGSVLVHGNAGGADKIAAQEGQKLGHIPESHPADWERYGKRAGFVRNQAMVDLGADLCLAFWDGSSRGTQHTVDLADAAGIPIELYTEGRP